MALEDFVDPEVGIAIAATALVASPQVRSIVRQGLVYGLAGAFKFGESMSSAARGVAVTAQQAAANTGATVQNGTGEAQAVSRTKRSPRADAAPTDNA